MHRKFLLLLCENGDIRNEAVDCAIGLADRIGGGVVVLLLLRDATVLNGDDTVVNGDCSRLKGLRAQAEKVLAPCVEKIKRKGVEVCGIARVGDPYSESLKFLAQRLPHAVVWGGDPKLVRPRRSKLREHWVGRLKDELSCPLVIPMSEP